MSAESYVNGVLLAAAGVTALIGAGADARLYPDEEAEGEQLPYIVYERGTSEPFYGMLADQLLAEAVPIVVTCWAQTRAGAEALADAVVLAMIADGVPQESRDADYDEATQTYGAVITFKIWNP